MRIISQDGSFDLPYDKCIVWVHNKAEINVSPIGEPDSNYTFGVYSTPEKAEKAMRLLHESFLMHGDYNAADLKTRLELMETVGEKRDLKKWGGIFQFPSEEDL